MALTEGGRRQTAGANWPLRLFSLAILTLGYGVLIGLATLGNLLYWGYPLDARSEIFAFAIGSGACLAVPTVYLLQRYLLPSGASFKWLIITFLILGFFSLFYANLGYLIAHFAYIPGDHPIPFSLGGLRRLAFASIMAEGIFAIMFVRIAFPLTPIAVLVVAMLFNRRFLMLQGVR